MFFLHLETLNILKLACISEAGPIVLPTLKILAFLSLEANFVTFPNVSLL